MICSRLSSARPFDAGAVLAALAGGGDGRLVAIAEVGGVLQVLLCGAGRVRRFTGGPAGQAAREAEYAVSALRRLAYRAAAHPERAVAALGSTGRRLEEVLLGGATRQLGDGPVVVVPPAHLHGVPWALLPSLRDRVHSVAPSARAWLRALGQAPPPAGPVVVVAGPGLHAGPAEVAAVAATHGGATTLDGAAATVARVVDALDGSALAHIAAHGTFRTDSPLFSSLRLADGPLTAYDLERLRRAPYRLVLSCCDSGRLSPAGAGEVLGLAAALLPRGTAGLAASLTPVDDAATAPAMRVLHEHLGHGTSLAEALLGVRRSAFADPVAQATAWSFVALGAH